MAPIFNFGKKREEFIEDESEDYLAITEVDASKDSFDDKCVDVRVFVLDDYENIRDILDVIRGEKTLCLIDIHLLRNKDPDELRRAVDKLKKTIEAIDGEIVGFHENWIMAAPKQVNIYKGKN